MNQRRVSLPRSLPRALLLSLGLAASLGAIDARADAQTANHNLVVNMQRAGLVAAPTYANLRVTATPVQNIYSMKNAQGEFMGYTNEAGTLLGDFNGFQALSPSGAAPRKLSTEEALALRHEMMDKLDVSKLIKVQHGDGGGRKLLLFSAIDCPACKAQDSISRTLTTLNTTFYVVPSTLRDKTPENAQAYDNVKRLWCSEDGGQAWKTYWLKGTIPPARQCSREMAIEDASTALRDLFAAVGSRVKGVPTVLREDGERIGQMSTLPAYLAAWGPVTLPPPQPALWLADAPREPDFVAQQAAGQPRQIKVNTKDLLKKLFN